MRKQITLIVSLAAFCSAIFMNALFTSDAEAIPAFGRQYKLSCTTCHAPIPKLKPYGDDFAGDGFILKEDLNERDFITAGESDLFLNKEFPMAARFDAYAVYNDKTDVSQDLQSPWGLKLLSGGPLFRNIGYYFYFYMSERGEVAGVEDAYLHFDSLFDTELDLMVGQFQTSDPLLKRELRLTFEDYKVLTQKIGQSVTNLTYDRGIMATYGIARTGTDFVGMLVNGNGKGEASPDRTFDQDDYKNVGFRVNQGIGKHLSVGGFLYYGKEQGNEDVDNEITYLGPDVNVSFKQLDFTAVYLMRKDSNPYFQSGGEEAETSGLVARANFAPRGDRSKFYFTALYNLVDSDAAFEGSNYDYETFTLNAGYWYIRNLRFLLEYTRDLEYTDNRIVFGFMSGF